MLPRAPPVLLVVGIAIIGVGIALPGPAREFASGSPSELSGTAAPHADPSRDGLPIGDLSTGDGGSSDGAAVAALAVTNALGFTQRGIPAPSLAWDFYEPSITASPTGALYVAVHSEAAFTERAPAWVSKDQGVTWNALSVASVLPAQARGPGLPGDEGIIVADSTGRAWMFDNGPEVSPLYGWCQDGLLQCSLDPYAYPQHANALGCAPSALNDRPWIAYGNNRLVLVSNGVTLTQGNQIQVGIYDLNNPIVGNTWNMCAGRGYIPGVPAVRDSDGAYAVPQIQNDRMAVLTGTTLANRKTTSLFPTNGVRGFGCGGSGVNFGFSGFSKAGSLYVAGAASDTQFTIAASSDLNTYKTATFDAGGTIRFLWISGSQLGEGALVTWATCTSYFAGHVVLVNGVPTLANVSTVGPANPSCGHYHGSSAGADGMAYVVVHQQGCLATNGLGAQPLKIWVQTAGPGI